MATLVAVNVGLPRDVAWNDRVVHTGAWKSTVDGPRMVRRLNVDGDGQGDLGGHGGEQRAVLVYQLDSYRHWAEFLNRADLRHGHFGENFTVDGLSDDEVCIGDRYRIGDAVFEVSQPRVTCYRVGLRLDEPRMAALLVAHRRPGFYMRVITEGQVQAGQEIVKIASGPELVSVAEIDALLYLPDHPRAGLQRALRIPALSPGWQASLRALADADADVAGNAGLTGAAAPPPAWAGFRPLKVTDAHQESREVRSLTLAAADGTPLPDWLAGQSITVRLQPGDGAPQLVRTYSLSNQPGSGNYRISVKRERYGAASAFIASGVHVGDTLDVAAPRGTFVLSDTDAPVVLVSAGVGVTPVLSMLHQLAARQPQRQVWWLHGARDGAEHPFAGESRSVLARLTAAHRHIAYSRPGDSDRRGSDYDAAGRLSAAMLRELDLPTDAEAYVCGPASFMAEMSLALADCGLNTARVHSETFGAGAALTPGVVPSAATAPHPPAGEPGTGPQVSFARSAVSAPWGPGYPACWSSPKPAMSRRAGRVAPGCATPVRRRCLPARSATTRSRSSRRRREPC